MSRHFMFILINQCNYSFDKFAIQQANFLTALVNLEHDLGFLARLWLQFLRQLINSLQVDTISPIFQCLENIRKERPHIVAST